MAFETEKDHRHREIVGIFSDANAFEAAIAELLNSGFGKQHISLLASEKAVVKRLGHLYEKVEDIEDTPWLPRAVYVPSKTRKMTEGLLFGALVLLGTIAGTGTVILAGGPLSLAIVSGAFGAEAGGLIGGALDESIEQHHAEYLEEQLSHGGLLLWVRISDGDQEKLAREILSRHSGRDVHACN
jgi:hypothetical protein